MQREQEKQTANQETGGNAMQSVINSVFVEKPIEEVYDFLSTASNWPKWHPATLTVYGAVRHPGLMDEEIVEKVKPGVRIKWKVTKRERPYVWKITAVKSLGFSGTSVEYTLTEKDGGTLWKREASSKILSDVPILGKLLIKAADLQSELAVKQGKWVMESY